MHFQYLVEDQSGAALIRILMQKIVELYPNATYDCKGFRGIGGFTRKNTIKETKTGKLLNDLATYLRGFDRSLQSFPSVIIDRFQRVEDRFSALAEILEAPEKNAAKLERNAKDAVANFLYSFNECLDHWRTYIVRAYGEGSNYFSAYQKLTTLAFDTYDEYKITYALRNFQHVDDVFDGISVRLGMPAQIYAHRQRLLDNSRFTAPQRAAFTKLEECFDLFPIFKTAKEQLEQIEKKLMFYTVTPEQENKAIDALKFKEELCGPHGVLLLGKLLDPNGNELEATDSTIIKLAQEQSEASLSYQDEIPWGVCRLLQLFQGTNYQDI